MGLVSKVVLRLPNCANSHTSRPPSWWPCSTASIRTTKALMKRARTGPINDTMAAENQLFGAMLLAPEAKEAFTAFFEKRKPDFSLLLGLMTR
ncbi:hypothetical protein LP420_16160 [Massilia sp. B-10]|nr:hypothetical protein LP420_16160 [Massilia sp. B-10]